MSYPDYEPSDVPWLGEVPTHWEMRRLRTVAGMRVSNVDKHTKENEVPVRLCNYVDVYKNDRITQQLPFMTATASEDEVERFRLDQNDVIITKDSETWDDIGVPALVTEPAKDLISGYHLAILRPRADTHGPYLFWALQSKPAAYQFHMIAKGVTRYGLSHSGIQSVTIPLPPLEEQAAIVRYLDDADRRIQAYVSAKERLITLLEEERQAVIHQAVTRGIDPNVKLKPSGVEWLGDVPEHWQRQRIKNILQPIDQKSSTGFETLLSLRRDHGIVVYDEHFSRPSQSESLVGYKLVNEDQLVVNRLQANNGLIFNSTLTGLGCVDILVMMLVCQMLSCQQNSGTGFSISCVAAPACMSLRKKIVSDLSRLCCGLTAPAPNGGCFRPNTGIGTVSINDSPVGLTKASGNRCFNISPATRTWNT